MQFFLKLSNGGLREKYYVWFKTGLNLFIMIICRISFVLQVLIK